MGYKIAIDGPAGAGKGYVAKSLSQKLNITYIDTGAMYRAFGYYVTKNEIDLNNEKQVKDALDDCNITFEYIDNKPNVLLNNENIENKIRNEETGMVASKVSAIRLVREAMVQKQRKMTEKYSVVMEGRDIGSIVFPDAEIKIFLTASVEERAKRRYLDLKVKNPYIKLEEVVEDIKKRDYMDINKPISPLVKTEDAVEVDTTNMTRDEVVSYILDIVKDKGIE